MREHKMVYNTPAGDIARCVVVCVVSMPAGHAKEIGLGFPVAFGRMPAREALLARVARIDGDDQNASLLRLVFHKTPQLAEAPVMSVSRSS